VRPSSVLLVCLGNICRSPTAEGVLRYVAAQSHPPLELHVDSAGTSAYHLGSTPDPRSIRAAARRGIDISSLRARQVTSADYTRFDLILAMDRENLRHLMAARPADCTASIRLFLGYADGVGVPEVPDPYAGGAADFELVLNLCFAAARGIVKASAHEGPQQPEQ
jgi:protein-tyrosine phosphatase